MNQSGNFSDFNKMDFFNQNSSPRPLVLSFRYSTRTQKGLISNNPKKFNQDSFIAIPNFSVERHSHLFSVCDGHGENGHLVSMFIKETFPEILMKNLKISEKSVNSALFDSVSELENKLGRSSIDVELSGSTMIVVFIQDSTIYISNVGDSRAILGRCLPSGKWESISLSKDHKPDLFQEKQRIEQKGGVVIPRKHSDKAVYGNSGRAWIPHNKIFGLSMSRSLGDFIAKKYGIIWEPEISHIDIEENYKFLIIGSDGVWEIIENEECVQLISKYYNDNELEKGANALLTEVLRRWDKGVSSTNVDDITFIIIFFSYHL